MTWKIVNKFAIFLCNFLSLLLATKPFIKTKSNQTFTALNFITLTDVYFLSFLKILKSAQPVLNVKNTLYVRCYDVKMNKETF